MNKERTKKPQEMFSEADSPFGEGVWIDDDGKIVDDRYGGKKKCLIAKKKKKTQ